MSVSTTSFYGLGRDFLARFNSPGYSPWGAPPVETLSDEAKAYEEKKAKQREVWRARQDKRNAANRAARANGAPEKSRVDLVLRVNPHSPICEPSGFAAHKAAIRKELAAA